MPYFNCDDIYINVNEFIESLDGGEWEELKEAVLEDLDINPVFTSPGTDVTSDIFNEALEKLRTNRLQLLMEDERTILKIAEKV